MICEKSSDRLWRFSSVIEWAESIISINIYNGSTVGDNNKFHIKKAHGFQSKRSK